MALSTGDKLGHYEILGLLGKGGMGEVYRGRDTKNYWTSDSRRRYRTGVKRP